MIFDSLKNKELYYSTNPYMKDAFIFLEKAIKEDLPIGKYEISGKELFASVQEYLAKPIEQCRYEGHRKYIDLQFIKKGAEIMECCDIEKVKPLGEFNTEHDVGFFSAEEGSASVTVKSGEFAVIFITESLASLIEDETEKYKDMPLPAVVSLPGKEGSIGYGMENIRSAALRAIGADILFENNN